MAQSNNVIDGVLASAAGTSPWWIQYLTPAMIGVTVFIGLLVGVIRLLIGINHYKISKIRLKEAEDEDIK